jgi:DNA replicative helicase MCM subunit Mcm2 (Cdc46/Mcm family)
MEKLQEYKEFWKKKNKIEGKQFLISCVTPQIYEKEEIKLGMLLSLIGGVS